MQLILEDSAKAMLDEYFLENAAPQCIRVGLRNACGVTGNTLCMRPDKETARDTKFESKGYTFVMLRHLSEQVGEWIRVDTKEHGGFVITTDHPVEAVACEIGGERLQDKPMECML